MRFSVHVEKSGRILIPVNVRRKLGLKEGASDLIVEVDEATSSMRVETRGQAITRIQKRLSKYAPKRVLSEELLAERREESRRG